MQHLLIVSSKLGIPLHVNIPDDCMLTGVVMVDQIKLAQVLD